MSSGYEAVKTDDDTMHGVPVKDTDAEITQAQQVVQITSQVSAANANPQDEAHIDEEPTADHTTAQTLLGQTEIHTTANGTCSCVDVCVLM